MLGSLSDFFRFWWALLYWNSRKTWFRLHGAHRDSCPCQNFSDFGHALDSRCDASAGWRDQRRFRAVCPLLTATPQGWRCGVDAERVRPFWGRALGFGLAGLLALHLLTVSATYAVLRSRGHSVAYANLVWPGNWTELRRSQEEFYLGRARRAAAGQDHRAAIVALQNARAINPTNLASGMALAHLLELSGRAVEADPIYAAMMQTLPEQRPLIARAWLPLLLASGRYAEVKTLATDMLSEDAANRDLWLRALLFSARQSGDGGVLESLLLGEHGLPSWCREIVEIEQLLQQRRTEAALKRLTRVPALPSPRHLLRYQIERLLALRQFETATTLLRAAADVLPEDEAALLRWRIFRAAGEISSNAAELEPLDALPLTSSLAAGWSALLIAQPEPTAAARLAARVQATFPKVTGETLPLYYAAALAAAAAGDNATSEKLARRATEFARAEGQALHELAAAVAPGSRRTNLTATLPIVPLPLEAVYVILEKERSENP